jgi:uncharacterized protein (DUF433 family)
MDGVSVLDRPVMSAREAAHQLRMPPTTLLHWLEGGRRRDTWYSPVLREKPTGSMDVTWGEVVEARYLRAYRVRDVSMQQLRLFIHELRKGLGIPYPLAHSKPFVGLGRRLVLEAQESARLPERLWTVYEVVSGQLILAARASEFLDRVEFAEGQWGEVVGLYPAGRLSPVVMRPTVASGAATVRGIRTEVLAEQSAAGSPVEEIAQDFSLPVEDVQAALSYEWEKTG